MNPEEQLVQLLITWGNAVGPAKDVAFNALVNFLTNNPGLAQNIIAKEGGTGAVTAAYEVYLLRMFAAGAAARVAQIQALPVLRLYLARLAVNFGTAPKVPHPVAMGLIIIGSMFLTGCSMESGNPAYEAARPSYEMYITRYISMMVQAKMRFPNRNIPSPMEFEQWYQENRM